MNAQEQMTEIQADVGRLETARLGMVDVMSRAVPKDFSVSVVVTEGGWVVGWLLREDRAAAYQQCFEALTAQEVLAKLREETNWDVERARARRAMQEVGRGRGNAGVRA